MLYYISLNAVRETIGEEYNNIFLTFTIIPGFKFATCEPSKDLTLVREIMLLSEDMPFTKVINT